MFRKTDTTPQLDLFTAPGNILPRRAQKKYTDEKAWHNQFFKLVTSQIDEEAFRPLFEETKMGAPNASLRILVAMSILKEDYGFNEKVGVYFLQTNLDDKESKNGITVWKIYNILKEVESSFLCMKTDLDLRPVYHKSDVACLAHLHLGILAYWVVTSIRYQLRQKGFNKTWSQILDIMLTQKSVTSEAKNLQDEPIHIEQCSEATPEVAEIYDKVCISNVPYKPKKSV